MIFFKIKCKNKVFFKRPKIDSAVVLGTVLPVLTHNI